MMKTPMEIAAKNLTGRMTRSFLALDIALTVIKPGYKPPRKEIVPRRAAIARSNRLFLAGSAFAGGSVHQRLDSTPRRQSHSAIAVTEIAKADTRRDHWLTLLAALSDLIGVIKTPHRHRAQGKKCALAAPPSPRLYSNHSRDGTGERCRSVARRCAVLHAAGLSRYEDRIE
jgi:hypothetical protein